ncbi:MAG: CoA-transferase, partial [Pseudomonadota bacterium]
ILGAFQVAPNGDLANWSTGEGGVPAVGGAMDLSVGAKAVRVVTTHVAKDGAPKLVERCEYPLTGAGVVDRVYTDLAVIEVTDGRFRLVEMVEGLSVDELQEMTGAALDAAEVGVLPAPTL